MLLVKPSLFTKSATRTERVTTSGTNSAGIFICVGMGNAPYDLIASMTKYRNAKYRIAKYRTQDIERQNIEVAKYRSNRNRIKYQNHKISLGQVIESAEYHIAKYQICIIAV